MPGVNILTDSFAERLRRTVSEHLTWYSGDAPFAEEFASGGKWDLPTRLDPQVQTGDELATILLLPTDGDLKDAENAVRLHRAFANITPVQARDPRLWTRFTHVEFWRYMRARWPVDRYMGDTKKAERYVESRYFVPRAEGRALLRNGMARLWWYAYLTYDDTRANPYELTAVLLKTLDITQQILERSIGRCRSVLVAFLEFLLENPDRDETNRLTIRSLAKSLNLFGGVAVLDTLTPGTIKNHLRAELRRIQGGTNS